jgi:hypothetical protein
MVRFMLLINKVMIGVDQKLQNVFLWLCCFGKLSLNVHVFVHIISLNDLYKFTHTRYLCWLAVADYMCIAYYHNTLAQEFNVRIINCLCVVLHDIVIQ